MHALVVCSNCRRQLRLPESLLNSWVKCPECGFTFVSESAATDPTVEAEAQRQLPVAKLDLLPPPAQVAQADRGRDALMSRYSPIADRRSAEITVPLPLALGIAALVAVVAFGGYLVYARMNTPVEWAEFESKEGLFRVQMPGRPSEQKQSVPTPAGKLTVVFHSAGNDPAFMVAYCDGPAAIMRANPDMLMDLFVKGAVAGLEKEGVRDSRVRSQKSIHWKGFPGREFDIEIPRKGVAVVRCYIVKARLYMLYTGGSKVDADAPDMRKFFDSFALTRVPADPPPDAFKFFNPVPAPSFPSKPAPGFRKADGALRK